MRLLNNNNLELLKTLPDNSVDSVVTDPPYGLSFMNKKWDHDVPTVQFWKEVYRVLKPGGHVLSFGGTRTYHRMTVNIEDAGFEIRDQIMWIYGTGFPKSYDIGKAVNKLNGSSTYDGWGTALKPANEPICVARKPLSEKNNATNVIKWGTGGFNISGCKIDNDDKESVVDIDVETSEQEGRFPANIIFDEYTAELLNTQSGVTKTKADKNYKHNHTECGGNTFTNRGKYTPREDSGGASRFFYVAKANTKERDNGLVGKENSHPTVKPINLMTYLCRLVTPVGGTVLDPYMGSGSTGIAARLEGFDFIGMELDTDYFKIAESRINRYEDYRTLLKPLSLPSVALAA